MKIKTLIKCLTKISEKDGNIEIFISNGYISCNHQCGEIKDFNFFNHWYTTKRGDKKGILLGKENPNDSKIRKEENNLEIP